MRSTGMAVPPPVGGVRVEDGLFGVEQGEQGEQGEQDVLGLDPAGTLAVVVEQRRVQDRAAAWELRAVAHWAELHRVDTRSEVGAVDPEVWHLLEARRASGTASTVSDLRVHSRGGRPAARRRDRPPPPTSPASAATTTASRPTATGTTAAPPPAS